MCEEYDNCFIKHLTINSLSFLCGAERRPQSTIDRGLINSTF
jgi:hypothetical protein